MSNVFSYQPVILCFCLMLCLYLPRCVKHDELQILLNLKAALNESSTSDFDSWEASKPVCSFNGITCNSKGSVKEIELSNKNLMGVLHLDSICQLQSLDKLSLGFNFLHDEITEDLGNCLNLQYLDLGNNHFIGLFPDISSLSKLQSLYLNGSGFSNF